MFKVADIKTKLASSLLNHFINMGIEPAGLPYAIIKLGAKDYFLTKFEDYLVNHDYPHSVSILANMNLFYTLDAHTPDLVFQDENGVGFKNFKGARLYPNHANGWRFHLIERRYGYYE